MNDLEFPLKPRFYIVNSFDRPDARFIAELAPDGMLYYIHPELREKWKSQGLTLHREATPLEDFGLEINIENNVLYGHYENESKAKYPDGKPRFWQGESNFFFRYPGPPGTKTKLMNVLDLFPPPEERSDEINALYGLLDTQECFTDPAFALAVCEEMEIACNSMITRIQIAMAEGAKMDALESTRFSRD